MIELRDWTLCAGGHQYMPPEVRPLCAGGVCDNHPRLGPNSKGEKLVTSRVVRVHGLNVVETASGSRYKLAGPPDPFFVENVLQKHGLTFDGDIGPIFNHLCPNGQHQ